jgi:site-specific DNA-methyltransferase (adenine-specific)
MEKDILITSDNLEYLKTLPDNSVDAIITDSPYGLGKKQNMVKLLTAWLTTGYMEITGSGFMGKKWDAFVPQPILWKECLRVLKPGGYLVSFFGTRTYHLGALAIEIAGFEIRDCIQWIYGSGFPKSKSCLKPANEPICVARKPGPMVMLGIDECRIPVAVNDQKGAFGDKNIKDRNKVEIVFGKYKKRIPVDQTSGRWPSNVIINEDIIELLDSQSHYQKGYESRTQKVNSSKNGNIEFTTHKAGDLTPIYPDVGGASRFFYVAKASPSERAGSKHPTIKPVKLMEHLVKLFCPPGGIVVDPHSGSGTTAAACVLSGRHYIGIDNDPDNMADAEAKVAKAKAEVEKAKPVPDLFSVVS